MAIRRFRPGSAPLAVRELVTENASNCLAISGLRPLDRLTAFYAHLSVEILEKGDRPMHQCLQP
jgi:hypothetical protein